MRAVVLFAVLAVCAVVSAQAQMYFSVAYCSNGEYMMSVVEIAEDYSIKNITGTFPVPSRGYHTCSLGYMITPANALDPATGILYINYGWNGGDKNDLIIVHLASGTVQHKQIPDSSWLRWDFMVYDEGFLRGMNINGVYGWINVETMESYVAPDPDLGGNIWAYTPTYAADGLYWFQTEDYRLMSLNATSGDRLSEKKIATHIEAISPYSASTDDVLVYTTKSWRQCKDQGRGHSFQMVDFTTGEPNDEPVCVNSDREPDDVVVCFSQDNSVMAYVLVDEDQDLVSVSILGVQSGVELITVRYPSLSGLLDGYYFSPVAVSIF